MYIHQKYSIQCGADLENADKIMILLHGRGSSAQGVISLGESFDFKKFHRIMPEATRNSWYPYGFMAPVEQNQPALDSALEVLQSIFDQLIKKGKKAEDIMIVGFSQGACLALEFSARLGEKLGGVVAFTGGLIGENLDLTLYKKGLNSPVWISGGDEDFHVPLERMEESKNVLENLGAEVHLQIYPGKPHSIDYEELQESKKWISERM